MRRLLPVLLAAGLFVPGGGVLAYDLTIVGGVVHGPGPMPDTPLPPGRLGHIGLGDRLAGASEFFNNGEAPPNVPGEMEIYGHLGGRLSNGVPFNEHVYGGVVSIGQGALKMLSVIASDGDMKGRETYTLDERLNWEIHTDLALDAGFPQGLVVSRNIKIFSGVLTAAPSLQSERGLKGGLNQAGSLPTGAPVWGRLGDLDGDGFLDGRIVGVGRVPLDFMFVPGSPLVMEREFTSNIPVTHEQAGILTLANLANLRHILAPARAGAPAGAARAYVLARVGACLEDFAVRARSAQTHLAAAGEARAELAALAGELATRLDAAIQAVPGWQAAAAIPEAELAPLLAPLDRIDAAVPALRSELRFSQLNSQQGE